MEPSKKKSWFKTELRNSDDKVNIVRYGLSVFGFFGCYVYNIKNPDESRHLHDHPFDFFSVILKGGYIKEVKSTDGKMVMRRYSAFRPFIQKAKEAQRITQVFGANGVWTLMVFGPRYREWGYHTFEGWIDNKTYREWKKKGCLPQF